MMPRIVRFLVLWRVGRVKRDIPYLEVLEMFHSNRIKPFELASEIFSQRNESVRSIDPNEP